MDRTAGTLGLHITAILLAVVFTAYAPREIFYAETGGPTLLNRAIFILCKYLIPTVLVITVATEILGGLHLKIAAYLPGTFFPGDFPVVEGLALVVLLILLAWGIATRLKR